MNERRFVWLIFIAILRVCFYLSMCLNVDSCNLHVLFLLPYFRLNCSSYMNLFFLYVFILASDHNIISSTFLLTKILKNSMEYLNRMETKDVWAGHGEIHIGNT